MRGARVCRRCLRRVEPGRLLGGDRSMDLARIPGGQPAPDGALVYVRSIVSYVFEPYDPTDWTRPPLERFVEHRCAAGAAGSQGPDGAPGS